MHRAAVVRDTLLERKFSASHPKKAEIAEIWVNGICTKSKKQAVMMYFKSVCGLDHDCHGCAEASSNEMVMQCSHCQERVHWHPIFSRVAVRKNKN
mmetsp:Transcript_63200/g.112825  ORF Transcript_63200/g.112825 Transcript_63200/m.112825 type:complete len:96 (+) Transcript_63200:73-360(+)